MKKTALILTAGLMAIGLASCGGNGEAAYSTALDSAMAQVSYSDQAIAGVTGNFDLITESVSNNYTFTVTYTAGNLVEYPAGYTFISISDDGKQAVVTAPNFLDKTLDFKAKYGTFAQCYIEATFHYNDKTSEAKRYNIKVNATSSTTIENLYSTDLNTKGIAVEVDGYYLTTYKDDDPYGGVFVGDGDSGIQLYGLSALPSGIQPGDPVHVTGTTSPYNGTPELAKPTMKKVTVTSSFKATKPTTIEFTEGFTWKYSNLSALVHVNGTVSNTKVNETTAGKFKVTCNLNVGASKLYVYAYASNMSAENYAAAKAKIVDGATVDVTGVVGMYSADGTFQASGIQMLNPIFK